MDIRIDSFKGAMSLEVETRSDELVMGWDDISRRGESGVHMHIRGTKFGTET